ncbi:uncharacterized protein LOC122306448 [Carya illinoinensis]|uniref:uncharacterized protein LOC122306448 n=1 Tax=Carya illinoinensis TaxID=32201 RepID=UPI001C724200|nr:uncharacterized protein LOC122306448 [Carya illinoinensis]
MDRSWMKKPRHTKEYVDGVNEFLKFACQNCATDSSITCPYRKCGLRKMFMPNMVYDHLISYGISQGYTIWHAHGERIGEASYHATDAQNNNEQINEGFGGMTTMLHDIFPMFDPEIVEGGLEIGVDVGKAGVQNENRQDADEPLYEGCTKHTKFSSIVHLWNMKYLGGLSNSIFTELLEFVNELLPPGASFPKNTYEAKNYMNELGLGYQKILVCPNGCMLFWKDSENLETCVVCGASKWKQKEFMDDRSRKGRSNDGILRHPADGMAWKTFDSQHDDFAFDPRNVRHGLSADGFNPFGNMSISYSTWLVMLVPYNLPPWMCMKRSSFMLSLIILGPSSPSMTIDVYLEPLISELKELWEVGAPTYDVCSKEIFTMRAVLMWMINDFLAYGDLSGWSTKGRLACPCCMGNTRSRWLKHGKKFSYMGHRRFLPSDHRWRMMAKTFDGTQEIDPSPTMPTPDEVMKMDDNGRSELDHKVVMHYKGPMQVAKEFKQIVINGTKFRTKTHENGKKTHNCGVSVCTDQDGHAWYGQVIRITEVMYYDGSRYVLFKCGWADVARGRGLKVDEFGFTLVVVVKTKPRDVYDTGEEEVTDDDEDEYLVNEYCINTSNHEPIEPGIDDVVWKRTDIDGMTIETP